MPKTWQDKVLERAIEIAGGGAPEEGDFNTAMIQLRSEVPDEEMAVLQRDLRAVETGLSVQYAVEDGGGWGEYDDPAWCYTCNNDIAFCECVPVGGGCSDCGRRESVCTCD